MNFGQKINRGPWVELLKILLLASTVFLIYFPTLKADFFWDDWALVKNNPILRTFESVDDIFRPAYWNNMFTGAKGQYRPLRFLLFMAIQRVASHDPWVYHLASMMLYAALGVVLYYVTRKWFFGPGHSMLLAILFIVYPVHVEAVAWIKNVNEILALLLSLLSFHYWLCHHRAADEGRGRPAYLAASLMCYLCAILSKEHAIVTPFFFSLFLVIYQKRWNLLVHLSKIGPHLLLLLSWLLFRFGFLTGANPGAVRPDLAAPGAPLPTMLYTVGSYLKILFWPFSLNIDREFLVPEKILSGETLLMLVMLAALVTLCLKLKQCQPVLLFGLAWVIVSLLPVCNIYFIHGRPLAESRLMTPSLGVCFVIIGLIQMLSGKKVFARVGFGGPWIMPMVLIAIFGAVSFQRAWMWPDEKLLLEDAISKSPGKARPLSNLGNYYWNHYIDTDKAMSLFERALSVNPEFDFATHAIAMIHKRNGNYLEAVAFLEKAIELNPGEGRYYKDLGNIYKIEEKFQKAIHELKIAAYYRPYDEDIWYDLARAQLKAGLPEEAKESLEKSLSLAPNHARAHNDFGVLMQKQNLLNKAFEHFRQALLADPEMPEIHLNLGLAYNQRGLKQLARQSLDQAIALSPGFVEAHVSMGNLLLDSGNEKEALKSFQKALELDPYHYWAGLAVADIFFEKGEFQSAVSAYQQLLSKAEGDVKVMLSLAQCHVQTGQTDRAEGIYREIIKENKGHIPVRIMLAELLLEKGDAQGARFQLGELEQRTTTGFDLELLRGKVLFSEGHREQANEIFNHLEQNYPNSVVLSLQLATLYERFREWDSALQYAEEAVASGEVGSNALARVAFLNIKENKWRRAWKLIQRAAEQSLFQRRLNMARMMWIDQLIRKEDGLQNRLRDLTYGLGDGDSISAQLLRFWGGEAEITEEGMDMRRRILALPSEFEKGAFSFSLAVYHHLKGNVDERDDWLSIVESCDGPVPELLAVDLLKESKR